MPTGSRSASLASYNGLGEDDLLIIGQTIQVPAPTEVGATTTTSAASGSGHVVVSGDSLSSIAYANGISISELASYNGLAEDDLLIIGRRSRSPGASGTTTTSTSSGSEHVVVSGESLSSIAYANGISISELASYNGLGEDDLLIIGQTISGPGRLELDRDLQQRCSARLDRLALRDALPGEQRGRAPGTPCARRRSTPTGWTSTPAGR